MWLLAAGLLLLGALIIGLLLVAARLMAQAPREVSAPPATAAVASPVPPPTPSATPRPTPAPATSTPAFVFGPVVLTDTFQSAERGLFRSGANENAAYYVANGSYTIAITQPAHIAWSPVRGIFPNVAVEVETTLAEGPPQTTAGIVFRYNDEQNFYFYGVSGDGYYTLAALHNGEWQPILDWSVSPQIRRAGAPNLLRVELNGARFRVYVNGTLLDEASDELFPTGGIALAAHTFNEGMARITFEQFAMYTIQR